MENARLFIQLIAEYTNLTSLHMYMQQMYWEIVWLDPYEV